jgi:hypothetical protein
MIFHSVWTRQRLDSLTCENMLAGQAMAIMLLPTLRLLLLLAAAAVAAEAAAEQCDENTIRTDTPAAYMQIATKTVSRPSHSVLRCICTEHTSKKFIMYLCQLIRATISYSFNTPSGVSQIRK